jgi:HSP20 family molecular chaperone IbpA
MSASRHPLRCIDAPSQEGVCVRMELPGMTSDALEVSVHDDQLIVRGERRIGDRIADDLLLA